MRHQRHIIGQTAISTKGLARHIHETSGIPYNDTRHCVRQLLLLVGNALSTGQPVNLHGIGTLYLRRRKGRTVRSFGRPAQRQPDVLMVKFKPSKWKLPGEGAKGNAARRARPSPPPEDPPAGP
ncbi:MAG: HU family DNA-binding protein [Verrucomicrobiota bacterium]